MKRQTKDGALILVKKAWEILRARGCTVEKCPAFNPQDDPGLCPADCAVRCLTTEIDHEDKVTREIDNLSSEAKAYLADKICNPLQTILLMSTGETAMGVHYQIERILISLVRCGVKQEHDYGFGGDRGTQKV